MPSLAAQIPNIRKDGDKLSYPNDNKIVFGLDVPKTTAQINADLKKVQRQLSDIKIPGRLDSSLEQADKTLKNTEHSMRSMVQLGASFQSQMTQAAQSISKWQSLNTAVTHLVSQTRDAVKELRQVDTLLTQISAANSGLSRSDLARIGGSAFNGSDLSLAARAVGNITAELFVDMKNAGRVKRNPSYRICLS